MTPRTSDFFSRMMIQGRNRATLAKELISSLSNFFQKFDKTHEEINISIMKNT